MPFIVSMFIVGNTYSKKDIYTLLNVPKENRGGAWNTGYRNYKEDIFIFSNVGIPGRTGHDYNNYWDGDLFVWEGKNKSKLSDLSIQRMLKPQGNQKIYLFTRTNNKDPFTFEGTIAAKEYQDTIPVKITWMFDEDPYGLSDVQEVKLRESETFFEGVISIVLVNKYERNPLARRICIHHFGCFCNICKFDFYRKYGEWGKNYIHVHHIIPISSLKKEYIIDPENDLIPICPNCHSIIHRKAEMLTVDQMKQIILENGD